MKEAVEEVEEIEDYSEGVGTEIVHVQRVLPQKTEPQKVTAHKVIMCPCCGFRFVEGQAPLPELPFPEPDNPSKGIKLTTRVKQMLNQREMNADGTWNYRFDKVARRFVEAMEAGHMPTILAFLERLEGKVPTRLANADGSALKMYDVSTPIDGPEAP